MLKNENIICISTIEWDFNWQGHQEIMSTFARNGNTILFIDNMGVRAPNFRDIPRLKKRLLDWLKSTRGFRQEMENLYVYSPVVLPFPYSAVARWINTWLLLGAIKKWMKAAGFHDPIIWTFLPTGMTLDIINNIDHKALVYYCIANFYEVVGNYKKLKKTEDELVRRCDVVFAQGGVLAERFKKLNNNVHIFPFGVKIENFLNIKSGSDDILSDIINMKRPIIGYIGGVHRHIDFKLLRFIAESRPEWSIVLIGPVQTDIGEISHLKNIFLLGKKDFSALPSYINRFDACIIPYVKSEYTATVYPTKLNEYHALGKPVIATPLPELLKYNKENDNLILIGETYREFTECITRSLAESGRELADKRISSAKKNSWNTRIEQMSELVEKAVEKESWRSLNWNVRLKNFYKASRSRALHITAAVFTAYFLVFYTPLLWFLAAPLKISEPPQKADAIVVFAGGAGESGRPGQGYEERVQYAVQLYKEGFAPKIIFSSGYTLIYKEPLLMEALAISQGVPKNAIVLEEESISTYDNVKFVKDILDKERWSNILLISSPYHMRRVSMVMKKVAPEIKAVYAPIPRSTFYGVDLREKKKGFFKRVRAWQIKGVIHEYLAIIYYYFRGYL